MGQSVLDSINHDACNSSTHDPLISLIKRRLRVESAKPIFKIQWSYPLTLMLVDAPTVGYSDGICAWLDGDDDQASLVLLHLESQERRRLTTENRQTLVGLRLSNRLVVAVSMRGYCHVWDIQTYGHKSFRIPSSSFTHFLVNGTNIAFSFNESVIHWSFHEGRARTVSVGTNIALLALHPSENQFTVTRFCALDSEEELDGSTRTFSPSREYHMLTEEFALDGTNEFHSTPLHEQEFPLHKVTDYGCMSKRWDYHEIHRGQSTAVIYVQGEDLFTTRPDRFSGEKHDEGSMLYLSLRPTSDRVAINILPNSSTKVSTIACVGQGVLYAVSYGLQGMMILKPKPISSRTGVNLWYQHDIKREEGKMKEYLGIFGDNKFVVLVNEEEIVAWVLDEAITEVSSQKP